MPRVPTYPLLAVVIVALCISAGCAHAPKTFDESPSMMTFRNDFLASNPDGEFNQYIERGEVVRGMGYLEVLASWGVPRARFRTQASQGHGEVEYWHYIARDDASQDWTQFTFVFEKKHLLEWDVERHLSKNGSLSQWDGEDRQVHPSIDALPRDPGVNAVKK